jgi:hypothetical protein
VTGVDGEGAEGVDDDGGGRCGLFPMALESLDCPDMVRSEEPVIPSPLPPSPSPPSTVRWREEAGGDDAEFCEAARFRLPDGGEDEDCAAVC